MSLFPRSPQDWKLSRHPWGVIGRNILPLKVCYILPFLLRNSAVFFFQKGPAVRIIFESVEWFLEWLFAPTVVPESRAPQTLFRALPPLFFQIFSPLLEWRIYSCSCRDRGGGILVSNRTLEIVVPPFFVPPMVDFRFSLTPLFPDCRVTVLSTLRWVDLPILVSPLTPLQLIVWGEPPPCF